MARQRGKETPRRSRASAERNESTEEGAQGGGGMPDLVRRALSIGFSGFFTTEEAVRKALGDTLPQDWIDFAVDQSGRAREEFLERISVEIGRSMADVDMAAVVARLMEGRTLEITAKIKLTDDADRDPDAADPGLRIGSKRKR